MPAELREIARARAPEMLKVLIEIALDTDAPHPARVTAADKVLDRAYGKAPAVIADEDGNTISWVEMLNMARTRETPQATIN